jgi:hypothetical protein
MKSSFYRTSLLLIPAVLFGMACVSCAPTRNISQYSQAQLSAITTREVDADMNATYRAAIDAVFDSGFTVSHSDREGGVVTATRKIDRTQERIWVYPYINDTEYSVSLLLREIDPARTSVRLSFSINGEAQIDEQWIGEFWRLMKRQVLMKEPVAASESSAPVESATSTTK